jgi:signal transduction histidine kinase
MFAISVFVKASDGATSFHQGSLVRLPPELAGAGRLAKYAAIREAGWTRDDLGYDVYARYDFNGNLIVVPGIILTDNRTHRKIFGYNNRYERSQIESFVDGIIGVEKQAFELASENINMLVHDLRNISGTIYNAALEAETFINRGNFPEALARVQNVKAAQNILKIRTDVLDFLGNPASIVTVRPIHPYPKVDKVSRAFKPRARDKHIVIDFSGRSHLVVNGPEILEIVPYVLIDNAIKYAPADSTASVIVEDDSDEAVRIEVSSLGPKIMPHEQQAIFEKGVRGVSATDWAIPGSGLGLYLMKQIVANHFNGSVSVLQEVQPALEKEGREYFYTTFIVQLPAAGKKAAALAA